MKIILEKNNNSLKNYKVDDTDYTKDVDSNDDSSKKDDLYDVGDTDYTQDEDVKYTESEEEVTPDTSEDNETEDSTDSGDESETTDYTEDVTDDSTDGDTTEDGSSNDETTDSSTDSTDEDADTTEETDEQKESENESQDNLINDFITLYKIIGSTINKLNSVKNSNIVVMGVHTQIIKNLSVLEKYTFNYILVFKNHSYTENLYKYNYFIEAFRINIQMLEMVKTIKI